MGEREREREGETIICFDNPMASTNTELAPEKLCLMCVCVFIFIFLTA